LVARSGVSTALIHRMLQSGVPMDDVSAWMHIELDEARDAADFERRGDVPS